MPVNKLEQFIVENGTLLGEGTDRKAFLYNDKAWKLLPHAQSYFQTSTEQILLSKVPNKFRCFFPETRFFGRVIQQELVYLFKEECEYFELIEEYQNTSDLFCEFLQWYESQGMVIEEIINNPCNVGLNKEGNQLKIIDWGV